MKTTSTYLSWILLTAAVCAWCGVVYVAWFVQQAEGDYTTQLQTLQQSSFAQNSALRMHAAAQDTASDRDKLTRLLNVDIVSASAMLQGTGSVTGVKVKLSGALPENGPTPAPNGPAIQAVGFALQADGSFPALMRTIQLLETLPLASSVVRLDLQGSTDPTQKNPLWHMDVYMRVFTTSNVSS
jgi:hypothetical protein